MLPQPTQEKSYLAEDMKRLLITVVIVIVVMVVATMSLNRFTKLRLTPSAVPSVSPTK